MQHEIVGKSPATKETLGDRAARDPAVARVFARFGIDYCCRGWQRLEDACQKLGIAAAEVESAIQEEIARHPTEEKIGWDQLSLQDLVHHVLSIYHEPLRPEMERLQGLATKVARVHHSKDPERLSALDQAVQDLREDLLYHMQKEEIVLFPLIVEQRGPLLTSPMAVMHHEHETTGALLSRIRELTNQFQPPEEACNSWRALYSGLEELEFSIMQHINFEEHILFPRGLQYRQGTKT
jgi:regulator of cell morphogenesis and NO signaling